MAPIYKLKSFGPMGVAEPIRYLLAYGGITYENILINKGEDCSSKLLIPAIPFGKLPILEIDNQVLFHSVAISRYIGKLVGLLPYDDFEAAELDAIAITVFEFGAKVHDWYHETDKEKNIHLENELLENVWPRYLDDFEKIVKKKGSYFGGKHISWADIYFAGIMESVEGMYNSKILLVNYPVLYKIYQAVHELSAIKSYISNRCSHNH